MTSSLLDKSNVKTPRGWRVWRVPFRWWILFSTVLLAHLCWEVLDQAPPVWDMAHHQIKGFEYLRAWMEGRIFSSFSGLSSYYPPLYYLQEAFVLRFLPNTQFLAFFSNLLALFMLGYSTYRIADLFMGSPAAEISGVLVLLFPLVAWTSRFSLLDVPLAGWVAVSGYLILRSDFLLSKGWTLVLGMAIAAGMLTKWTAVLFLFFPLLYAMARSANRRRSIINLVDALVVVTPLIFWWYLPNLTALLASFQRVSQVGLWEGDPGFTSALGWVYYPRILSSYYLFLPLTLMFLWGAAQLARGRCQAHKRELSFLWWWLLGGLLLLTLLPTKDPRYVMPLACPLAVLVVLPWQGRFVWEHLILAIASIQFLSISFATPFSPTKIALFELENDTDYRSMRQEWVLFQTDYFELAGPPREETWPHEKILVEIGLLDQVGFVPDTPYFNPVTFQLFATRKGYSLQVFRLGEARDSADRLESVSFVVGKTGWQGISYLTCCNSSVYRRLEELDWPIVQTWDMPDQSQVRLWRNPN